MAVDVLPVPSTGEVEVVDEGDTATIKVDGRSVVRLDAGGVRRLLMNLFDVGSRPAVERPLAPVVTLDSRRTSVAAGG